MPEKIIYLDVLPFAVSDHNLIFVVGKSNTCTKSGNSSDIILERDKLKLKAIKSKSESIQGWDTYKTTRNIVSYTLQNDKQLYYRNLLLKQKRNPKESWQTINRILGCSYRTNQLQLQT